jgi:hypothetical protein
MTPVLNRRPDETIQVCHATIGAIHTGRTWADVA